MNHTQDIPAYGLWSLVVINSAVFIISIKPGCQEGLISSWSFQPE